jgi:hypothetical protein
MSKTVTSNDMEVAVNLVHLSIFGEPMNNEDEAEEDDDKRDLNKESKTGKMEIDSKIANNKKRV